MTIKSYQNSSWFLVLELEPAIYTSSNVGNLRFIRRIYVDGRNVAYFTIEPTSWRTINFLAIDKFGKLQIPGSRKANNVNWYNEIGVVDQVSSLNRIYRVLVNAIENDVSSIQSGSKRIQLESNGFDVYGNADFRSIEYGPNFGTNVSGVRILADPNDNFLYIIANCNDSSSGTQFIGLARYNLAWPFSPTFQWSKRFRISASADALRVNDCQLVPGSDNFFIVFRNFESEGNFSFSIARIDGSGNRVWSRRLQDSAGVGAFASYGYNLDPWSLQIAGSSVWVMLARSNRGVARVQPPILLRYDFNGNLQNTFHLTVSSPTNYLDHSFQSMTINPDGSGMSIMLSSRQDENAENGVFTISEFALSGGATPTLIGTVVLSHSAYVGPNVQSNIQRDRGFCQYDREGNLYVYQPVRQPGKDGSEGGTAQLAGLFGRLGVDYGAFSGQIGNITIAASTQPTFAVNVGFPAGASISGTDTPAFTYQNSNEHNTVLIPIVWTTNPIDLRQSLGYAEAPSLPVSGGNSLDITEIATEYDASWSSWLAAVGSNSDMVPGLFNMGTKVIRSSDDGGIFFLSRANEGAQTYMYLTKISNTGILQWTIRVGDYVEEKTPIFLSYRFPGERIVVANTRINYSYDTTELEIHEYQASNGALISGSAAESNTVGYIEGGIGGSIITLDADAYLDVNISGTIRRYNIFCGYVNKFNRYWGFLIFYNQATTNYTPTGGGTNLAYYGGLDLIFDFGSANPYYPEWTVIKPWVVSQTDHAVFLGGKIKSTDFQNQDGNGKNLSIYRYGTVSWNRTISFGNTSATSFTTLTDLEVDADGNLYACGRILDNPNNNSDNWIAKFNGTTGNLIWYKIYRFELKTDSLNGEYTAKFGDPQLSLNSFKTVLHMASGSVLLRINTSSGDLIDYKRFSSGSYNTGISSMVIGQDDSLILTLTSTNEQGAPIRQVIRIYKNYINYKDSFYEKFNVVISDIPSTAFSSVGLGSPVGITMGASSDSRLRILTGGFTPGWRSRGAQYTTLPRLYRETLTPSITPEFSLSLNSFYAGGALVPAGTKGKFLNVQQNIASSGPIAFNTFYQSPDFFEYTQTANIFTGIDVRASAVNAGWNQQLPLRFIVGNGIVISSNDISSPAMTVSGSFPNGVEIVNNGYILGMGGRGGNSRQFGNSGGTAIYIASPVNINNLGIIAGGGGGGGAGYDWGHVSGNASGLGGGGGSGLTAALGGLPLPGSTYDGYYNGIPSKDLKNDLSVVFPGTATFQPGPTASSFYNVNNFEYYWFSDPVGDNNELVFNSIPIDSYGLISFSEISWPVAIDGWTYIRDINNYIEAPEGRYYPIRRFQASKDGIFETPGDGNYFTFEYTGDRVVLGSRGGNGGRWGVDGDRGGRARRYAPNAYYAGELWESENNYQSPYGGGTAGRATSVLNSTILVTWENLGLIYGKYNRNYISYDNPQLVQQVAESDRYNLSSGSPQYWWYYRKTGINVGTFYIVWNSESVSFRGMTDDSINATSYSVNGYIYYRGTLQSSTADVDFYSVARTNLLDSISPVPPGV